MSQPANNSILVEAKRASKSDLLTRAVSSRSIFFRLTVPSLFAVFVLWVGYTAFWAGKHETDARRSFDESGKRAAQLFSRATADALWEFDRRSAEVTLGGLAAWPGFVSASVSDQAGSFATYPTGTDEAAGAPNTTMPALQSLNTPADRHVLFTSPIVHPEHGRLGTLDVVFDQGPMRSAIWVARQEALIPAALGFALLGLLLTIVARSVTRPLERMTQAVERVADGDLGSVVPDCHSMDEVGRLARALEVFRTNAGRLVEARAEVEANRRVAELAMIDELTGLGNRRAVSERFSEIEADATFCNIDEVSLVHADLDGFKQINDTVGHEAGDHVLRVIAKRFDTLSDACRLVARIGGDEFVLLVEHGGNALLPAQIADKLIHETRRPITYGDQFLRVGASVGIAHHRIGEGGLFDTLANADIALYRAKAKGKGCFVEFDETHRREVVARKRMSDEILDAIERRCFVPYFQGIFDSRTRELHAVEVLARWEHPEEGIRSPEHFLDVATDLGLMRLIDKQVVDEAIDFFIPMAAAGIRLPKLCLNVSITRLIESEFVETLIVARRSGIEIDVELLESAFLDDPTDALVWHLDRIRDLGVGLNIDDFGTGHASVAGLIQIQPDKVKIDRRFVMPMLESDRARSLVKTLQGLCQLLEISTVAEGVETLAHANALEELGCDYLQGYALMEPVSASDLEEILTNCTGKPTASIRSA